MSVCGVCLNKRGEAFLRKRCVDEAVTHGKGRVIAQLPARNASPLQLVRPLISIL
jgi:hypothetical protein